MTMKSCMSHYVIGSTFVFHSRRTMPSLPSIPITAMYIGLSEIEVAADDDANFTWVLGDTNVYIERKSVPHILIRVEREVPKLFVMFNYSLMESN